MRFLTTRVLSSKPYTAYTFHMKKSQLLILNTFDFNEYVQKSIKIQTNVENVIPCQQITNTTSVNINDLLAVWNKYYMN